LSLGHHGAADDITDGDARRSTTMNTRTVLAGLTLTLGTLAAAPAFAQGYYHRPYQPATGATVVVTRPNPYARPVVVVTRPAPPVVIAQPAPPVVVMGRDHGDAWHTQAPFVARIHFRMNEIESRLRFGVERGRIAPQALSEMAQQRAQVNATLARASSDGFIGPRERFWVDGMVNRMEQLDEQFRIRRPGIRIGLLGLGRGYGQQHGYHYGYGR
jgi:hypothetical protein